MADQKLSSLPTIAVNDTTLLYGTDAPGVSQGKFTGLDVKTYIGASAAGVTSLNSETGAVVLTSSGGTVTITKPTGTTINLEAASGAGTVTTTGTPLIGQLTQFSGATSITNGNLSGDVTTGGSLATTLATVNANVGTFGSATQASVVTVNAKGLTTAASNVTITPAVGSITGLGTGVATALGTNVGTAGSPVINGGALGTPSSGVATNLTGTASGLSIGGNATTATTATNATNVGITNDVATATTVFPTWVTANTGNLPVKVSSTKLSFVPSTGILTSTGFAGPLTGNVTGNVSGSSGSTTGNAATVTTNANLTGVITSVGNATSIASQTGTGTKFVVDTSPTLVTPILGVAAITSATFAQTGTLTYLRGKLVYDTTMECLTFNNVSTAVSWNLGRENLKRCWNATGTTIPNGAPVYISGFDATSGLQTIALAKADSLTTLVDVAMTTESIATGASGEVTTLGQVNGLDTSAFTTAAPVYVSAATAGALTTTAPSGANFIYQLGTVGRVNVSTGYITISPQNRAVAATAGGGGTIATTTNLLVGDGAGNASAAGAGNITSASANALTVGLAGATNPAFAVDASTASSASGIVVKSAVTGGVTTITATDPGGNGPLTVAAKGSGNLILSSGNFVSMTAGSTVSVTGTSVFLAPGTRNFSGNQAFNFAWGAASSQPASTEVNAMIFDLTGTQTHSTGAITTQRDVWWKGTTHAFAGASTITDAHGFYVTGPIAGTNATITTGRGLTVGTWNAAAGTVTAIGLETNAPTGATTNVALQANGLANVTGGITVGNSAVANANALDWYQEGTFTPVIVGLTTAGVGVYTSQTAQYTRIGNRVDWTANIAWTGHTGTGQMAISNLPFTCNATNYSACTIYGNGLASTTNSYPVAIVAPATTQVQFNSIATASGTQAALAVDTVVALLIVGGTYFV